MKKVRVKFCGITSLKDGEKAVKAGADAVGFVFFKPSPRYITPEKAGLIIRSLPPFISSVGIFVNEDMDFIEEYIEKCGLNTVQLHGDEGIKYCLDFEKIKIIKGVKLIKAIRLKGEESLREIEDCPADAILLDTYKDKLYGGTGKSFNRSLAVLAKEYGRPLILAGGLSPDNVYDIIKEINPYGVDVSSGIEYSHGKKNIELMEEFIKQVRMAEEEIVS